MSRAKALLLDANGTGLKNVFKDTFFQGIFGIQNLEQIPWALRQMPLLRRWLRERYEYLSYVLDWREALCDTPALEVDVCNINNLLGYTQRLIFLEQYDLIVVLHSATGDSVQVLLHTAQWLNRRRGPMVVFLGNEYELLDQKIDFINHSQADYICSQLPVEAAQWVYGECASAQIVALPHALNPRLYFPFQPSRRSIDIGFIGDLYWYFIGDIERTRLIQEFEARSNEWGLHCDIRQGRVPRTQWSKFLNSSKGALGAESGTYYLDRRGRIIAGARRYEFAHPGCSFEDVFSNCFLNLPAYVSGKAISSRHFEPIGTKTCQILLSGHYNGILRPGEHYIEVRNDLTNIEDAVRQFKDEAYRAEITERTYEYVMSLHTYQHRVQSLLQIVGI